MGWGRIEGAHNVMTILSQSELPVAKISVCIEIRYVMYISSQVEKEIIEIIFPSTTSCFLIDALKIDPFTLYNSRIKLPMKKKKLIVIRFRWCKQNHIFNFYQD